MHCPPVREGSDAQFDHHKLSHGQPLASARSSDCFFNVNPRKLTVPVLRDLERIACHTPSDTTENPWGRCLPLRNIRVVTSADCEARGPSVVGDCFDLDKVTGVQVAIVAHAHSFYSGVVL
jgi:hypothetical protein